MATSATEVVSATTLSCGGDGGYITAAAAKGRKLIYKVDYLGILKMGSLPRADIMYT